MNVELLPSSPVGKDRPLNFEAFAQVPEYIEVNTGLIRKASSCFPDQFCHVDIATGTGMAPKLLIAESQRIGREGRIGRIIGIDPNTTSLRIAEKTTPHSRNVSVEFIEGFGQNLATLLAGKIPKDGVDGVSILDAIHEIPGEEAKKQILSSMADILKPGGVLILNSAFTTYGMEPKPLAWGRWKSTAFGILGEKRNKDIEAIKIYSPEEYKRMLAEAGLTTVIHEDKKIVVFSKDALAAISLYPEFINGVFRDMTDQDKFSLTEKSTALIQALGEITSILRGWWEIIAQKPD